MSKKIRSRSFFFAISLATSLITFAIIMLSFFGLDNSGSQSADLGRTLRVSREVKASFQIKADGTIVANPGYVPPDWLTLIVINSKGKVALSNFKDVAAGTEFSPELGRQLFSSIVPGRVFISEIISQKGKPIGAYVVSYETNLYRVNRNPAMPLFATGILLLLAFLSLGIGSFVATRLSRSLKQLEGAAVRVASGDLDSPVPEGDFTEVGTLASAMESMRLALKEDQNRRYRFLAAVSHDFRTPLTSVKGYVEAIQDGLAKDPETLSRYLSIMAERCGGLEGRINELLDFTRMETGEWRLNFSPAPLKPFLERLASRYTDDAEALNHTFEFDFPIDERAVVNADWSLLARALENLVTNAIRYSPAGTTVKFSAARESDLSFSLMVDDAGPGVSEAESALIFEPFYRGCRARLGGGSGLGLSIAKSVVVGHGWRLEVSRSPLGGARFQVRGILPSKA
jgi:signal transduction histidine kinase